MPRARRLMEAVPATLGGQTKAPEGLQVWLDRRKDAMRERALYEPTWHLCRSYFAGRQWVGWNPDLSQVIGLDDHPDWRHREKYTVNIITPFVWDVLSRMSSDQLRPTVTFRRNDVESESFARQAQRAFDYAWDEEIEGDRSLLWALIKEFCYGTSAVRCYFDPLRGPSMGQLPIDPQSGEPVTDPQQAFQLVSMAQQQGYQLKFREVFEGRSIWEPLSAFNILPPPGVEREEEFPWLIIERAVDLDKVKRAFGAKADALEPQILSATDRQMNNIAPDPFTAGAGKLQNSVMLCVGYEMPSKKFTQGRMTIWSQSVQLDDQKKLPYTLNGEPHHGVAFFHYHRVEGRFWAQGIVEKAMGPQRQMNRARSQMIELKDRNLGRVYATRGTITAANEPVGKIMELIEVTPGHPFPQETQGVPPGNWVGAEAEIAKQDLEQVLGLSGVFSGFTPSGVSAYSALSLIGEAADRQMGPVIEQARAAVKDLSKLTLSNIRMYWPAKKEIALAGPDGLMDTFFFNSRDLPESVYIMWPAGPPKAKSPAAETQKIFDLYDRSIASGRPLPISWLYQSLDEGQAKEIPEIPGEAQRNKAELENMLLSRGQMVYPAQYDDDMVHIDVHRSSQSSQDLMPGNEQIIAIFDQHIQLHVFANQQKMMMAAQAGAFQNVMPVGGGPQQGGPAGLPPAAPGTEQTAQRGPIPNSPQGGAQ